MLTGVPRRNLRRPSDLRDDAGRARVGMDGGARPITAAAIRPGKPDREGPAGRLRNGCPWALRISELWRHRPAASIVPLSPLPWLPVCKAGWPFRHPGPSAEPTREFGRGQGAAPTLRHGLDHQASGREHRLGVDRVTSGPSAENRPQRRQRRSRGRAGPGCIPSDCGAAKRFAGPGEEDMRVTRGPGRGLSCSADRAASPFRDSPCGPARDAAARARPAPRNRATCPARRSCAPG